MLLMGRFEYLRGRTGEARHWWHKALEEAQAMHERYMEGLIHLEIGKRLVDRQHLQKAEEIMKEIGAELEMTNAKEALSNLADN